MIISPIYKLKYGPMGQLMDNLFVKNTYHKGMNALLAGLKGHIEEKEKA